MSRPERLRLARPDRGQFRGVGAAERDQACGAKRQGQRGVARGAVSDVAQGAHAHRVRLAGLAAAVVLEQERHAAERAVRQGTIGVVACPFVLAMHHDVELRVELLDPFDRLIDELARVHFVAPNQIGERRGVEISEGIVHR